MLLGAARCCSALVDGDKNVGRVIKIVHVQSSHGIVAFQFFMEHCVDTHKTQEVLAEMFGSFDYPELSSA